MNKLREKTLITYIRQQKIHHAHRPTRDEMAWFATTDGHADSERLDT